MNGFIYVMSNPSYSGGLLKIGKSKSDPSSFRQEELYTTGVPQPFVIEYSALVEDYNAIEIRVHELLSAHRPNKSREFFNCSIEHAILTIQQISKIKFEEYSGQFQTKNLTKTSERTKETNTELIEHAQSIDASDVDFNKQEFDEMLEFLSEKRSSALPTQKLIIDTLCHFLREDSIFDQKLFSRHSFCYWFMQKSSKRPQTIYGGIKRIADSNSEKVLNKLELAAKEWETAQMFAIPNHQVSGFNHQIRESIEKVLGDKGGKLNKLLSEEEVLDLSQRTGR